ncbi:hypothetical protein B1H42_06075 [Enterobacter cloacae subsp. cloacae]|nr:hypothetical protein B1H42_06075 [Enterobacter cloacae subsp. cloacae]ORC32019.1 hypothetical protein B2M05_04735 [Enterobacter cloacae subsp. cloacae]
MSVKPTYEELERYGRQADITIENLEQKLAESQREFRAADATSENLQMQVEKLAAENAGLNAFVDALLSIAWQGGSADGAEIQDLALKHELLRQEVYSSDEYETLVDDPGNFEDGDPVYFRVETPATDAFLAEVRAQGVEMLREHPAIKLCSLTHVCDEFAAQLRKGVQS